MKALTLTAMLAVSTMCAGVAVNADLARDYLFAGKNELIEYRKEVREGETPVELQPGTEIVIKVKAVM